MNSPQTLFSFVGNTCDKFYHSLVLFQKGAALKSSLVRFQFHSRSHPKLSPIRCVTESTGENKPLSSNKRFNNNNPKTNNKLPVPNFESAVDLSGFLPSDFATLHELVTKDNENSTTPSLQSLQDDLLELSMHTAAHTAKSLAYQRRLAKRQISDTLRNLRKYTLLNMPQEDSIMMISEEQCQFLTVLTTLIRPKRVLEIGTFTGISTLSIASALVEEAEMISVDVNQKSQDIARKFLVEAGLIGKVLLRNERATSLIEQLLENGQQETFDLVFIDADKENYDTYYEKALLLTRPGGVVLVDDTLWSGRVADDLHNDPSTRAIRELNAKITKDSRVKASLVPIFDGVMFAVKLYPNNEVVHAVQTTKNIPTIIPQKHPLFSALQNKIFAIEGNIGAGKSTLITAIQKELSSQNVPIEIFREKPNDEFLQAFYDKPDYYGFPFQMYMLHSTLEKEEKARMTYHGLNVMSLVDRSTWGNQCFAETNYRIGNLSARDYEIYKSVMNESYKEPDVLIYLDASPETCYERMRIRNNKAEENASLEYLDELDTTSCEKIIHGLSRRSGIAEKEPIVVILDWSEFQKAGSAIDKILKITRGEVRIPKVSLKNLDDTSTVMFDGMDIIIMEKILSQQKSIPGLETISAVSILKPDPSDKIYRAFKRVSMKMLSMGKDLILYTRDKENL